MSTDLNKDKLVFYKKLLSPFSEFKEKVPEIINNTFNTYIMENDDLLLNYIIILLSEDKNKVYYCSEDPNGRTFLYKDDNGDIKTDYYLGILFYHLMPLLENKYEELKKNKY